MQVALGHFAYFPGTVLPRPHGACCRPFDDYRLLVLLATLALLPAALLFPAPFDGGSRSARRWRQIRSRSRRCGSGRPTRRASSASFSPSLSRRAPAGSGPRSCSRLAVLLKQFALVALPFLAVMLLVRARAARTAARAGGAFGGVFARRRAPVPDRRSRRALGRHDRLRRGHLPDRRLRALGAAGPRRA